MPDTKISLPDSWLAHIGQEFDQPYMQTLKQFLLARKATETLLPPAHQWFAALNATDFDQVKVVIIGQDPYPTPGHAHGLCFSVQPHVDPLPKSLQNINQELLDDLGIDNRHTGCLDAWAQQGVLLLNAVLTVEAGRPGAHQNKGWETFTDAIIQALAQSQEHLVFFFFFAYAQKKGKWIDTQRHCVIQSPHPSPLSAYRGFFGSRPFSKANHYLSQTGQAPIDWQLPVAPNPSPGLF